MVVKYVMLFSVGDKKLEVSGTTRFDGSYEELFYLVP